MTAEEIIKLLPYQKPFLFVDSISEITEEGVTGSYKLKDDEYFFEGHFPGNPVAPGVIIMEIMAQIGLVSLGIYLNRNISNPSKLLPFFSSAHVDFLAPAQPGDELVVTSKKKYFRFSKLKCEVNCTNMTTGKEVCRGDLSGMIAISS